MSFWPLFDYPDFTPYHWLGIRKLACTFPSFYERFLCFIFPAMEIHIVLEVVKRGQPSSAELSS